MPLASVRVSLSDRVSALLVGSLPTISVASFRLPMVVNTTRRLALPQPGLRSVTLTATLSVRPFRAPTTVRPGDLTVVIVGAAVSMLT